MKRNPLLLVSKQTIIAALYGALTLLFLPISFLNIQFRISEILMILIFFDPFSIIGLTIGCLIANTFSELPLDIIFGTLATFISGILMIPLRKVPFIALLFPVIGNGIIVGLELFYAFNLPLLLTILEVAIGEFVVLYLIALPIYYLLKRNKKFNSFFLNN